MLLRAVTTDVLIGNGDAHGKNLSLLHEHAGTLRLGPLYDLICTLVYGDDNLAMYIDDVHKTSKVTTDRLVNEAASWGMSRRRAEAVVAALLDAAPEAIRSARSETPGVPDDVVKVVESQLQRLKESSPDGVAPRVRSS
jgi:serine/threonine-protein kinase HipA